MISISEREFDQAVTEALAAIPDEFRKHLENVVVEVRPRPDAKFMQDFDVPGDLLGLYDGVPLEDKLAGGLRALPDRIYIFRDNLCDMCETLDELIDEIYITVLHEVGHHFGMDEGRLDELGYG
jgi:predicted Zn-dependent protease with MMP-like domain